MFKSLTVTLSLMFMLVFTMSACTSINVRPLDAAAYMQHVCIEDNPKVIVEDFVSVVRDGFTRHGISSEVYSGAKPANCEYTLTYSALRSWDGVPYLSKAELRLQRTGREVAAAEYRLKGGGGFALTKYQGVKTKMDPVIDELLKNY